MWRGGLLLVGASVLFEAAKRVLRFVQLPAQLELGFGLVLTGFVLVVLSLILERIQDSRNEGDLRQ